MTAPDSPWRSRPRRRGLYIPALALLALLLALSPAWFWARSRVDAGLQGARLARPGAPATLSFQSRRIGGFPFRLDVDLQGARLADPSGWSLYAPRLKAEAYLFAPDHWVMFAPDGVVVGRRDDGPVVVTGRALRASLSDVGRRPPRLSVEGLDLAFSTPPGARPFVLTSAKELHIHTKAGPDDQGAAFLEIDQGQARLSGLLARIAQGKAVSLQADAIYSHADALAGDSWPQAMRDWAQAGGSLAVRRLKVVAGGAIIESRPGTLEIGADGRLAGVLPLTLKQAAAVIDAMGTQGAISQQSARAALLVSGVRGAPAAALNLTFQAGRTTLGPVGIGPAPRLY